MARFDFRLAALLRVRERERDERRAELAIAVEREHKARDQVARLEIKLAQTRSAADSDGQAMDLARLQAHDRFRRVVHGELEQARKDFGQATAEMEVRRQAAVAADQQVRALEKLRERQQKEFQRQQAMLAQRELDEAAARGWQKLRSDSGVASAG
jgi:flagellar export protein FliJ